MNQKINDAMISYNKKRYSEAIIRFTKVLKYNPSDEYALYYLAKSYMHKGRHDLARQVLYDNERLKTTILWQEAKRLIELKEMNLQTAYDDYIKSNENIGNPYIYLSNLAKIYYTMGDFKEAEAILHSLLYTFKEKDLSCIETLLDLINVYIITYDYEKAWETFNLIDITKTNSFKLRNRYKYFQVFLLHEYLHEKELPSDLKGNIDYSTSRIFDTDDTPLFAHLQERHVDVNGNRSAFIQGIDLKALVKEVKQAKNNVNPSLSYGSKGYYLHMPDCIGITDGILTKDLLAVEVVNTDRIIAIYPVVNSKEFDKDGLVYSDELRLKRERNAHK